MVSASSSMEPAFHLDFLRKCQIKARQLQDLIGTTQVHLPSASAYNGPIPELDLPFPHDILLSIDAMGLPQHLCEQMKSKVTEKIFQFQRLSVEVYQRTCHELPGPLISFEYLSDVAKMYQTFYNEYQIPKFRAKISTSKATLAMVNKHSAQETRRPIFNSEYTPSLERYFEHNAYPSRPDRLLLARKSSMTERQIEVWFQNHRNRAKKEGISLKRMSPHQSSPLEFLEQKTLPQAIPLNRTPSPSQSEFDNHNGTVKATANPSSASFPNLIPSPYTFPTPYRRNSSDSFIDPLSQQDGTLKFPPPDWPRKPATQTPPRSSINMEEFIVMFASKLSIRRGSGIKPSNTTLKTRAWFSATVTIPSPAPHPALIRGKVLSHPSISTTPSTNTAINVSNLLSSTIQPLTKHASKPRKMAPFPFRTPQKSMLPSIVTSSTAQQLLGSRTSSFASASSSQSRSSSASIGSSPEPTTPPHSPIIDSHATHEPVVQEFTSDTYFDLFAGIIDPRYDFSQNLDNFLKNEDIFSKKHLPISMHNFPYLDPLFVAT